MEISKIFEIVRNGEVSQTPQLPFPCREVVLSLWFDEEILLYLNDSLIFPVFLQNQTDSSKSWGHAKPMPLEMYDTPKYL